MGEAGESEAMRQYSFIIDPQKNPLKGTDIPTVTAQEKGEDIRYMYRNGRKVPYIHHYEKPEVARARAFYEYHIRKALKELNLQPEKLKGPCYLTVNFFFKKKTSSVTPKPTKPDCDNLVKLFQDVLADVGFFEVGDQQITSLHVNKYWFPSNKIAVFIGELEE